MARALGVGATLLALLQSAACASALQRDGGRFRHERGFEIADPAGPAWTRVRVEGALLAYRGAEATMSWLVGCERPVASPELLAPQLLIGLGGRSVTDRGPVAVDGGLGWVQRVRASRDGVTVRMKTVTALAGGCVLDWVLVTTGEMAAVEGGFDGWWGSFRARAAP